MIDFYLKKGDVAPPLLVELQDFSSNPVNISGAGVNFNYRLRPTGSIVSRTGEIYDAANGIVKYTWTSGDTQTAGLYNAEFVVTYTDTVQMTFPPGHPFIFLVLEDIS